MKIYNILSLIIFLAISQVGKATTVEYRFSGTFFIAFSPGELGNLNHDGSIGHDVPIEAISRMMLFGGFTEGKWTPDLAILLAPITFDHIMAIGMKAEIPKMKLSIGDTSNNKFHREFSKFKNEKNATVSDDKRQEKFVEKITKEFSDEPSGLMNKENI